MLTSHVEHHPLALGGRDSVGGDAEVVTHVPACHRVEGQHGGGSVQAVLPHGAAGGWEAGTEGKMVLSEGVTKASSKVDRGYCRRDETD